MFLIIKNYIFIFKYKYQFFYMVIKIFDKLYKNYIEENESNTKNKKKIKRNISKDNYKYINNNILRYKLLKIK